MSQAVPGGWEAAVRWLRDQPDKQDLVRDSYYDDPLPAAAERYWRSEEWAAIRALLAGRRGRALDAGAGRGIASYALAREGFAVTALEPDPSALVGSAAVKALARDSGLPIEVVEDVSETIPFADSSFDVVFARAVLHHVRDLDAALAEFRRVLKPGGLFIAAREHVISRDRDLPAFLAAHSLHERYGGENAHRLTVYVDAIAGAGLTLIALLKPLESPINYAPHSRDGVRREIAARLPGPASAAAYWLLKAPLIGPLILRLAGAFDNRPGRHYSFVAVKPG